MSVKDELQTNYLQVIGNYGDFSGRAGRKEFWMFVLVNLVIQLGLNAAFVALYYATFGTVNLFFISSLYAIAMLVPGIAVGVRRLHDINLSGWWTLVSLVPVVGSTAIIVMHCIKGTDGENRFGPRPREITMDRDDSEGMMEQAERALEESVDKLKKALLEALTGEKQLEAELKKRTEEFNTWEKRAMVAVESGNDELARNCLAKKREAAQSIEAIKAQLASQKDVSASLKGRFSELEEKLRAFRMKKESYKAASRAGEGASNPSAASSSAMDRWEEKVRAQEARNEANREFDRGQTQQWQNSGVEDELAALKKSVSDQQSES